jgi:putative hemolysin
MLELLIIPLCLLLNALLAGAEIAFVAVNKPLLRELVRQSHTQAQLLLRLRENPERTLSVVQIGITLVGSLAGAVGGAGAEEMLSPRLEKSLGLGEATADTIAIVLVVLPLTYLTVVLGELVPKSLALRNSLGFALRAAPWLSLFDKLFGPIVTLFEWSTKLVLTLLGLLRFRRFTRATTSETEQEAQMSDAGISAISLETLSSEHRQYVINLVNLERKRVRDIYLPWQHVVYVHHTQPVEEIQTTILSSGHTRVPVVEEEDVIGILNTKEFMALRGAGTENWSSLIRPAVKIQANTPLLASLRLLQERRMHMAVVYAEQKLAGVVTLEDILEEIVGELYDEDDDGKLRRILSATPRTMGLFQSMPRKS